MPDDFLSVVDEMDCVEVSERVQMVSNSYNEALDAWGKDKKSLEGFENAVTAYRKLLKAYREAEKACSPAYEDVPD